ncbi:MAG: hypothetical protein ACRECY_05770 [Phyllobacterium sp.]
MLCLAVLCSILAVSACGGREAHPVKTTDPTDSQFDCAGIAREFDANERSIISINTERSDANAKNAVLGVTGAVLFFPAVFFMDPKSPERVEIEALRNRNVVLTDIARTKGCSRPKSKLEAYYKRLALAPPPKVRD